MKRLPAILSFGVVCCLFCPSFSSAIPDPWDSIIVQSCTVTLGVDTSVTVRVYITNKDTLAAVSIALLATSVSNGAYMKLTHPRNFGGAARFVDSSLQAFKIFSDVDYNGVAPDTITGAGFYHPLDLSTTEPPNAVRKAFMELKFDSVFLNANASSGIMEIDSVLVSFPTGVANTGYCGLYVTEGGKRSIPVNFLKSRINIVRPTQPCYGADMNGDSLFNLSDVVEALNCVFLGSSKCQRVLTTTDILFLFNEVFPSGVVFRLPPGC